MAMVYEKIPFRVDISRLRSHVEKFVLPLPPAEQSPAFGGWSVQSRSGSYLDAWEQGHLVYAKAQPQSELETRKAFEQAGIGHMGRHVNPTEICHGYLAEIMEQIKDMGLSPRRARIIRLRAGKECSYHRDAMDWMYAIRLHIPIITNPGCFFVCEAGQEHMPADGSVYILAVNRMHKVINRGTEDRFHLVMDVTDSTGVTQFHRKPESVSQAVTGNKVESKNT